MEVAPDRFVAVEYTITRETGEVIEATDPGTVVGFIVGMGQILPAIEARLLGLRAGAHVRLSLEAEEVFGQAGRGEVLLPGEQLVVDVTVVEVRLPTEQDLAAVPAEPPCARDGCGLCCGQPPAGAEDETP